MLEAFRKQSQNTLIWGAFAVIIFVFIFFFGPQTSGYGPGSRTWTAKVEGHTVYDAQLMRAYERLRNIRRDMRRLSDAELDQLKQQVALDMSLVHVLAARADDAGLAITENEAMCYIVNWHRGYVIDGVPICQAFPESYATIYRNDHFPYYADGDVLSPRYRAAVRSEFAMSVEEYEQYKSRELLALKYLTLLSESVAVPRELVEQVYLRRNETVELAFVRLDPSRAAAAPVTDADVETWASQNANAISGYYGENVDEFTEAEQVRVRRIHRRKPRDGGEEAARTEYEGILARAQAGEDFDALVREFTQFESERETGGDMGLLPQTDISSELWDLAHEMEVGEVRGLERDAFWNVVKLEELQPARVRPLDEVRLDIARRMLEESRAAEAAEAVGARGQRILALAAGGMSLEDAATAEAEEATAALRASLPPTPAADTTDDVVADDTAEDAAEDAEAVDAAPPLPTVESFFVGSTGAFARERAGSVINFNGQMLRTNGDPADNVPGIGASRELAALAFELTDEAPLHDGLVEVGGVAYIVRLTERVSPPETLPENEIATLADEMRTDLATQLVDPVGARMRLTLNFGSGPYAPVVENILQAAINDGSIKLNTRYFNYDPVEALGEDS